MPPQTQELKILRFVCVAFWVGLMVLGLWPFNFFPRNRVEWLGDSNGIHFDWHGQMYTDAQSKLVAPQSAASATDSFSIEIWLKPDKAYSWGTVLSVYDPARPESLRMNQSLTDLVLRGEFRDQSGRLGFKPVWITRIFENPQARFVTITSGPQGTTVYLEGVREHFIQYAPAGNNFSGRLLVGHSGSENSAWAGTVRGLAIYDRALTADEVLQHYAAWNGNSVDKLAQAAGVVALYPFDERAGDLVHNHAGSMPDLVIPLRFYIFHRRFLADPVRLQKSDISDAVINIFGFIPFGLLLSLYFSRAIGLSRYQSIAWAIVVGGMTSFSIEFLQAYLPTRDSSYLDLINNILGTTLGAIATERVSLAARFFKRSNSPT
jgi:VanZ family protein